MSSIIIKEDRGLLFSLLLISLLPSLIYVVFETTSISIGVVLACLLFISYGLILPAKFALNKLIALSLLLKVLIFYQILISFSSNFEITVKSLISIMFINILAISSLLIGAQISAISIIQLRKSFLYFTIITISLGFVSLLFEQNFLGYQLYAKSVFPFSEPSHYAIIVGPIAFATGFMLTPKGRGALILSYLLLGFLFPSLIVLVFSILMLVFYIKRTAILLFVILILFLGLYFINYIDFSYFLNRIDFRENNTNLTALVYMQGWSEMLRSLMSSSFLGLGMQNLGKLEPSELSQKIFNLAGEYKNRNDGSFLASKLVSEYGVIGLVLVILYIFYFIKTAYQLLFKYDKANFNLDVVYNALFIGFSVELFCRGISYFTPGVIFMLASVFIKIGIYQVNYSLGNKNVS